MKNMRTIAGILALGSLWGFAECIIGAWLRDANLPAGSIMTAVFGIGLMVFSKTLFPQRGVQLGMGLVAGTLRLLNPFGGCFICSAIAIMAEGALFELLWIWVSSDIHEVRPVVMQSCLGIISGYILYVGGYTITQILTPLLSSAGFDVSNLIAFIPQILASGLLPAVIGAVTVPVVIAARRVSISIKDTLYYPVTAAIAVVSWCLVLVNTIILLYL
jgi:hypothetical protein